jgi:hypothetical protein
METRTLFRSIGGILPILFALSFPLATLADMETTAKNYISGGIGEEDRQAMQEASANYNLWITFAVKKSGEYLADTQVTIKDASGNTVLDATSDGPWFYAKLPKGKYRVDATVNGKTQTKTVIVHEKRHAELYYYWSE